MRATSFLSGLFLASVVLAAPVRKTDISDADPFNTNGKRQELPSIPSVPSLGEVTQKLKDTTQGLNLPTRDLPSLPTSGLTQDLSSVTGALNTGDLASTVSGATNALPLKVPSSIGDIESTASPVTAPVTAAVTPFVTLATNLLNGVLSTLTGSDDKVQVMMADAQTNAGSLVSTLQTDLTGALSQIEAANPTLQSQSSGPTAEVEALVSQVQVAATTLIADLQSVAEVADVSTLVSTVKSIVSAIQGTGL